jgi:hypothetical protein
MKNKLHRGLFLILALAMIFSVGGCAGNQPEADSAAKAGLQEIGDDFATMIQNTIVPVKDNPARLHGLGIPVSRQEASYNVDALHDFYDSYQAGDDASVTMVFTNTAFVVVRVGFHKGNGYYMRYQYNEKNTGPLEVTTKMIDSVDVVIDDNIGKVELKLYNDKKDVATFSFKNIHTDGDSTEEGTDS